MVVVVGICGDSRSLQPRQSPRGRLPYVLAVIAVMVVVMLPSTHGDCAAVDPGCYCRTENGHDNIYCETLGKVWGVPPFRPSNTTYDMLKISGETTLWVVQANAFSGVKIKNIELVGLGVRTIELGAFSGLGDILEVLRLNDNTELEPIPADTFN